MDFGTAVKTCLQKYFTFSGRARRSEFWWFMLFCLIAGILLTILDVILFSGWVEETGPFNTAFSILTFIPTLSVGARRLHDINKSGWWQVLPILPAIAFGVGIGMSETNVGSLSTGVMGIGGLLALSAVILLIVWFATDSHQGDNKYGPSPKYGGQGSAFD